MDSVYGIFTGNRVFLDGDMDVLLFCLILLQIENNNSKSIPTFCIVFVEAEKPVKRSQSNNFNIHKSFLTHHLAKRESKVIIRF